MGILFFTPLNSLFLRFIHIAFFAVVVIQGRSGVDVCEQSEQKNCGKGPNINYPFWILNSNNSHCGNPKFAITCDEENHPILNFNISGEEYIIKDVFYSNNSFLIANSKVYHDDDIPNNTCPIPLHNFTLNYDAPFEYSPSTFNIFFFYNCTQNPIDPAYTIACESNSNRSLHSFVVYHEDILLHQNFSIESCESSVNAPIEAADISALLNMNFTDVLRNGFILEWNDTLCSKCVGSGGGCGYDDKGGFVCSCSGRFYSETCPKGHILNWKLKVIIGLVTSICTLVIMGLSIFFYVRWRNRPSSRIITSCRLSSIEGLEKVSTYYGIQIFSYSELEKATGHFDPNKQIGDGGFGSVYKGKLRDGRVVAVKILYESNYKRLEYFVNEVEILARLHHQNLVTLYGCTSFKSRELLLVYEYISNGTVADHLHGERAKPGNPLSWNTRLNIAIETANALSYLHASDVIHRDVKTSNILVDDNFCVKVADFGLSRLFPPDATHVSTAPQGTPGYVDPEYHECYRLTNKSDVYSFGVVLVELISSKQAVDITRNQREINLSTMAIMKIQNNGLRELVDTNLGFDSDFDVRRMITGVAEVAFMCLQSRRDMRPTMEEVVEDLKRIQCNGSNLKNILIG